MPKISESSRHNRLDRVFQLVQRHPNGLSEREIADRLSFERRTVNNYLNELDMQGRVYKEGLLWCPLPYESIPLRRLEPSPEEAVILYLASRLFVKQSDQRHVSAENVLLKLADILSEDIQLGSDLRNAAQELAQRPNAPDYEDLFRTVVQAYVYRRRIKLLYHPYRGEPFETTFAPYLLEPSGIGFATYAIGHSSVVDALRTYKIERIIRAELTREEYSIPPDFDGLKLLRNAWSIFYGEDVIHVVLRFHPDVARRVQETNWHISQQLAWDEEQEGYLLMELEVADTTDLKPWIRTWGAHCEVLEPESLRHELTGEARRLAHLYGWKTTTGGQADHSRFNDIFGE